MLVSPSESATFRALGTSTWVTESWGVDVFWCARGKTYGVQRKALADFCASEGDGRLSTERLQMFNLDHPYLILETGERGGAVPREMPNGTLAALGSFGRPWTGAQLRGCLYSLMADGIHVILTRDESETIERVKELELWSKKESHDSGRGRGRVPTSVFGERGAKEYGVWLLRSLPGVGAKMADAIWEHFGGLPIVMREGVEVKDLMAVDGVGKVTAQRIMDVFTVKE